MLETLWGALSIGRPLPFPTGGGWGLCCSEMTVAHLGAFYGAEAAYLITVGCGEMRNEEQDLVILRFLSG